MLTSQDPRLAGRVAFTYPNFVSYTLARFFIVVALEMQSVAVGWQVYEITKRPLDLGYVGLAQFAPGFVLFLFAGHAADIFDRRKLLMCVLRRVRPLLGASARDQLARPALGSLDLRRSGVSRSLPQFQLSGEPRHPAAPGSRRTFFERGRLECQHLPDRNHRRSRHRRNRLCSFPRPGSRLRARRNRVDPLHPPNLSHSSRCPHRQKRTRTRKSP